MPTEDVVNRRKVIRRGGKRVLICGARDYKNKSRIKRKLEKRRPDLVIEGGAPGADTLSGECADELGIAHCTFKANWKVYHKAAGPIRNKWMLSFGEPDEVWAFHPDLSKSKGTADMVKQAESAGIRVRRYK